MKQKIRDLMTRELTTLDAAQTIADAARSMRRNDVGDVLVTRNGKLAGILTDRDIVVRCVAEDSDPEKTAVESVCSQELATLSPDDDVDAAVKLMSEKAVRRIPVLENGELCGIVSLGDLAEERDQRSALGEISAAAANR